MKRIGYILLICLISLGGCKKEAIVNIGSLQISIQTNTLDNTEKLSEANEFIISVIDEQEEAIFSSKRLVVLQNSDSIYTETINMLPGQYTLSSLLILNEQSGIVYHGDTVATEGKLPLSFTIVRGELTTIRPALLSNY